MGIDDANAMQATRLKHIAKVQSGTAIEHEDLHQGSISVFGANGMLADTKHSNTNGPAIIISRKAPFGRIYWSNEPCWANETTFFIDQDNTAVHLRWLFYALQTLIFDAETAAANLTRTQFEAMQLFLPDPSTQVQIATYLDWASNQWKQLICEKQKLLALCAERRQTLINDATTSGLQAVAPGKPTNMIGIIQSILTIWQPVALRRLVHTITPGVALATLPVAAHTDEFGVIKSAAIQEGRLDATQNHVLLSAHDFPIASAIQQDDIFIIRSGNRAEVGKLAIADASYPQLTFADTLFRLRVDSSKLLPNWLYWVLLAEIGQIQTSALIGSKGTERINLSQNDIMNWIIPLPSLPTQAEIVAHLNTEVSKLDKLAQATQQSIDLLQERRSVLLNDTITGQFNMKEQEHDFA